jgi:tetratricopeptide (TPR) repeat protein
MHGLITSLTRMNRIRPAVWILALALTAVAPTSSLAQQPTEGSWVGKRVVQKYRDFQLKVENQVVNRKGRLETYRVEHVNGPWLWLHSTGLSGWALADQVLPVERAIEFFTDHIRVNPRDAYGYSMRGTLWLYEKQELDSALDDYNNAMQLDPTNVAVFVNRGNAWSERKEFEIAINDYNQAALLDPRNAAVYTGRGLVWHAKAEYDRAIADYSEAIWLDSRCARAYVDRAFCWSAKKEYDKAIADCSKAIELDPQDAAAYRIRGGVWEDKQEYDKAIADFSESIRLDPKRAGVYIDRGEAWKVRREWEKAIADYNQAISLDCKCAVAHDRRAWLWATCPDGEYRDAKRAVESATKACELSTWNESNYLDTLAAAYAEAGDFDAAVKWQSNAIELLTDEKKKQEYRSRLKLYGEKKPYRESQP